MAVLFRDPVASARRVPGVQAAVAQIACSADLAGVAGIEPPLRTRPIRKESRTTAEEGCACEDDRVKVRDVRKVPKVSTLPQPGIIERRQEAAAGNISDISILGH